VQTHFSPSSAPHVQKVSVRGGSHSSDSSSAYSGSDTMQSSNQSSSAEGTHHHGQEVDLSGLMESVVDSDEEEEEDASEIGAGVLVRDAVRECLEKDPADRNEADVDVLLEFARGLSAFSGMTQGVRRALVAAMVFAVVEKAGTVVMTRGEELDSWSVIVNGSVEVEEDGEDGKLRRRELHLGDAFGITPTMEKMYHRGVMRTKVDDCQFVCVTQADYYRILSQGEESQKRHEDENGKVVLVTELRPPTGVEDANRGPVVRYPVAIRGTPEKLMAQLMEDNSAADPTYTEDFLLTYRTFLTSPVTIMERLLTWFDDGNGLRDKVTRVLLLWVNNHFTDFETDPAMMEQLERFESRLDTERMHGQLRMLNFACAAKARRRTITLARSSRDEALQFGVAAPGCSGDGGGGRRRGASGGGGNSGGVFVSWVERGSRAAEVGLKRGDQILEINGQSFEGHQGKAPRALELLRSVCHLSITVKSNLLAFNEMQQVQQRRTSSGSLADEESSRVSSPAFSVASSTRARGKSAGALDCPDLALSTASGLDACLQNAHSGSEGALASIGGGSAGGGVINQHAPAAHTKSAGLGGSSRSRINRAFNRLLHSRASRASAPEIDTGDGGSSSNQEAAPRANASDSTSRQQQANSSSSDPRSEFPEHVLKVYKADQSFKYLLVHRETTAQEVVMLALQEFGLAGPERSSSDFALCEVSVAEGGFVKQRRLPPALQNLAERIGLSSRYLVERSFTLFGFAYCAPVFGTITTRCMMHFFELSACRDETLPSRICT